MRLGEAFAQLTSEAKGRQKRDEFGRSYIQTDGGMNAYEGRREDIKRRERAVAKQDARQEKRRAMDQEKDLRRRAKERKNSMPKEQQRKTTLKSLEDLLKQEDMEMKEEEEESASELDSNAVSQAGSPSDKKHLDTQNLLEEQPGCETSIRSKSSCSVNFLKSVSLVTSIDSSSVGLQSATPCFELYILLTDIMFGSQESAASVATIWGANEQFEFEEHLQSISYSSPSPD